MEFEGERKTKYPEKSPTTESEVEIFSDNYFWVEIAVCKHYHSEVSYRLLCLSSMNSLEALCFGSGDVCGCLAAEPWALATQATPYPSFMQS